MNDAPPGTAAGFAIVTGAASGLGRALAVELGRRKWHVALTDRDLTGAEETRTQVQSAGGSAEVLSLDVREESQWVALREQLQLRWPRLDLLVNNAGVCSSGEVGEATVADWDWVMSINLRGVFLGCHTFVDWLKANPRGAFLLNMSSAAGVLSFPCMSAYNASKAAVISLSETMYVELKPHNVGVSVACPWFIQTNLLESGRFTKGSQRDAAQALMGRAKLTPEDFARKALDATFRRKLIIVTGRRPKLLVFLKGAARTLTMRLFDRIYNKRGGGSAKGAVEDAIES
jgi:NAD(P)-dependent dehydrogenase (short-subunit alcohol dehydrogenase family)